MKIPNIEAIKKDFPDGYKMSALTRLAYRLSPTIRTTGIECAEFVRLLTGWVGPNGKWESLSPPENKAKLCIPGRIPHAGDAFVQKGGKWWHIGMILRTKERSDKTFDLDIVDANVKLDGVIRYRTINSKDCYGFAPMGLKEKYASNFDQHYMPVNNPIPFRSQYNYDICVPMSVVRAVQHAYGDKAEFSVAQLHAEMAIEGKNINSAGKCLEHVMEVGLIAEHYNKLSTGESTSVWKERAIKASTRKRHKARGELLTGRVDQSTKSMLKKALSAKHVLIATTDSTLSGWDKGQVHTGKFRPTHTILITGFNERDEWIIANHWEGKETGFLHPDYPLSWVYKVTK